LPERIWTYLTWFVLHFALLFAISTRDIFFNLSTDGTISPPRLAPYWAKAEAIAGGLTGAGVAPGNPFRQAVTVYTNAAGIESAYGFFAPNVPNSYKLVYELQYPDGNVAYELPEVGDSATGLRLNNLFESIADTRFAPVRELLFKMLAYSVWQEHPTVKVVRVVFGAVVSPSLAEFEAGKRESYEVLCAYDFTFPTRRTKDERQ
jgi:hypothetical protein